MDAQGAQASPSTRTYSARVTGGGGSYARAEGNFQVTVTLTNDGMGPAPSSAPPGSTVERYAARVLIRGHACLTKRRALRQACPSVFGSLSGEATDDPRFPPIADLPSRIKLLALRGSLRSVGPVTARGELLGTGYIRRGRRTFSLTIAAGGGRLEISGVGPPVDGFSSP